MFVQIPHRRVLEMDRGSGLPLGAPRLHLVASLLSSRATFSSTAAATPAATTGFTRAQVLVLAIASRWPSLPGAHTDTEV